MKTLIVHMVCIVVKRNTHRNIYTSHEFCLVLILIDHIPYSLSNKNIKYCEFLSIILVVSGVNHNYIDVGEILTKWAK